MLARARWAPEDVSVQLSTRVSACLVAFAFVMGCSSPKTTSEAPPPTVAEAAPEPSGISVKLTWSGEVADEPVANPKVAECAEPAPTGRVLLGEDRGLANVFVSVPGAPGVPHVPGEVTITASACRYAPRAVVVPPATPFRFANEDSALHTFHLWKVADGGETNVQNIAVAPESPPAAWTIDEPGLYRISSDRYQAMEGWLLVAPAGTAGVTDENGRLELATVAAGKYVVDVFHPATGTRTQAVTVPASGVAALHLELQASSE